MLVDEKRTEVKHYLYLVLLLLLASVAVIPLYWMVITALQQPTLTVTFPPEWFPSNPTLFNFKKFLARPYVWRWTLNSLIVALTVTGAQLLVCVMAGYSFAKKQFPGKDLFFWMYVGSMMVPSQVTLVPLYITMSKLGLNNSYYGLILPAIAAPFGVFLMKQFMSSLPSELIEAAKIDGCSEWGTFVKIILPLSKSGLAVLGIFTFVRQWNDFVWPLIITNSAAMRTLPIGLTLLQEEVPMQYGLLMAGATFAAVPMLIIFFSFQRYFLKGVTVGALKG